MAFREILEEVVASIGGSIAATLMGTDGIAVAQNIREGQLFDVEGLGAEYSKVVDEVKRASAVLNFGDVEEVVVSTPSMDVILRLVTPEYYIAFIVKNSANLGKARYFLKKAASKAIKEI